MNPELKQLLLFAGMAVGYLLLMLASPVWLSFRDSARCMGRHKQLWGLPAIFAFTHASFRLWVRWYEASVVPGAPSFFVPWRGWQPVSWSEVLAGSWLTACEGTAGLFHCLVNTFPLSALAAVLFLVNWRGYQAALFRALHRRLGWVAALWVHLGLILCAMAATVKPALFGGLPRLNALLGADALLRAGELINCLGFVFEYLLGVALQIYLILLCFVWMRGLSFDFDGLRRFALRRFAFVVKWSGVILLLSTLGVSLPRIIASFHPELDAVGQTRVEQWITAARWALASIILTLCAVQIILVLHNESLRRAVADHARLLRHHGWRVAGLIATAFAHFLLLAVLNAALQRGLAEGTWPSLVWGLLEPLIWAGLAGWFLGGWVCMFRRCEIGRPDAENLVKL